VSHEAATGASENTAGTWAALPGSVLRDKADRLDNLLDGYGSTLVAFSGGVDSALLAVIAARRLGDATLCVTAESPSYPARHRQLALTVARDFGLRHEFISTAEVESFITVPIENALNGTASLKTLRSKSVLGLSAVAHRHEELPRRGGRAILASGGRDKLRAGPRLAGRWHRSHRAA